MTHAAAADSAPQGPESGPISTVLDRIEETARQEKPSAGEVIDAVGQHSTVTLLLVPALVVVTPLSGVPLLSSICGLTIALISLAGLLGRSHVWLPGFVTRRRIEGRRLSEAVDWLRRPVGWIERRTRRRLPGLVNPPFDRLLLALCLLCGLAMPVLELVPFTSSFLGGAVALLAISIVARDGLFASLAFIVMAAVFATPVILLASGGV
ncbi:exopolysaccharide biosynthesis protein [Albimonas pacifica]|uniref:Uncharacterized conserved protein n=1 Tax=Albimonas pacifica TaxID=1114924 RepID=A0A1I3LXU8_9RHOB|nr:exopolysaccharide biosynthesis protein [Albimonas pacifica]SFI89266.1 Uncharacterized conserved protein [Albimonas pacifica]